MTETMGRDGNPIPLPLVGYLAGLIDGEGSFNLVVNKRNAERERNKSRRRNRAYRGYPPSVHPRFDLALRADDRKLLVEMCTAFGVGRLYDRTTQSKWHPTVVWVAQTTSDCLRLITVLDQFPLRSKKAHDYAIWREAVLEKVAGASTERLLEYKRRLEEGRKYSTSEECATCPINPEIEAGELIRHPAHSQLRLIS